jgi:WD40 repeat protein
VQNHDDSGSFCVFDIQVRKFLPKVTAHASRIRRFAVSNDGHFAATCSEKGTTIKLFCLKTGELVKKFRTSFLKSEIADLSFSRRSEFLVSVSKQMRVQIFSVSKNLILKEEKADRDTVASTQASTRSMTSEAAADSRNQNWMTKLCQGEASVKTLSLEKSLACQGALVALDEGNDKLIVVNGTCQLSTVAGVL